MKLKIVGALVAGAALAMSGTLMAAENVQNTSYTTADGTRVLQHEIVVDTPRDEVWEAFTTSEGWTSWVAPVAFVDFRRAARLRPATPQARNAGQHQVDDSELPPREDAFTARNPDSTWIPAC